MGLAANFVRFDKRRGTKKKRRRRKRKEIHNSSFSFVHLLTTSYSCVVLLIIVQYNISFYPSWYIFFSNEKCVIYHKNFFCNIRQTGSKAKQKKTKRKKSIFLVFYDGTRRIFLSKIPRKKKFLLRKRVIFIPFLLFGSNYSRFFEIFPHTHTTDIQISPLEKIFLLRNRSIERKKKGIGSIELCRDIDDG